MVSFVGRQPELAVLRARLTDVLNGSPQVVRVQGPPGIGKTALLDHFLREAGDDDPPVVVRASGEETEELLAYGIVDQLARSAGQDGRALTGIDAGDDPVTVGTRVLEFLDGLDIGTGVVLVVDEAHWADRPSMHAVVFALRRLVADRVLAVVALRDDRVADLPDSLGRLVAGQRGTVLRLRGLDEVDLHDLAVAVGVPGLSARDARRLRYGTQGNPLHARALLEEFPLSEWRDDGTGEDQPLPPPRSFRRLVQDRYAGCAPATQRLIEAAAVLDPHCPLPQAAALAGIEQPLPALDEATAADLLEAAEAETPWRLAFPHPLVRSAVYEGMRPGRRHELHTAAAALITDEAIALRHRVAAATEADDGLAGDLTRFADAEAARQAFQSGAAHLVTAARLSSDPRQAHRKVLRAVVWMVLRGDAATATTFASEIETYEEGPLRDLALGSIAMASDDPPTAEDLLGRAWAGRAGIGQEEQAIIALMTGIHWFGRLNAAATVDWCERARAAADPSSPLYAVAMSYLLHGLGYAGRRDDAVRAAVVAEARPGDPIHRWMNPRSARGLMHLVDDDIDAARTDFTSAAMAASGLGMMNTAAFSWAYLARTEWTAGDWDDAMVHADRALAINLESDFGFQHSAITGIAVLVPAARGDWDVADAHVRAMIEHDVRYERAVIAAAMAQARIGEAREDPTAVISALDPVRAIAYRDGADEPGFWPWPDLYADALVATGRVAEADAFLIPHERLAADRGRRIVMARLARSRGRIEAAAGRPDGADAAFSAAIAHLDGLRVPFELARVELAAGAVLRRLGRRRRAADLLAAAQERFTLLGATPYADRCSQELAASGLNPTKRIGRDRFGLTSQELVVARLAADGRSNREVADELVVSIKTIEYHLRNAFGKLGITSRRQLADRLAEVVDAP